MFWKVYAGSLSDEPAYEDILVNLSKEEVAFFRKLDTELQKIVTFYNGTFAFRQTYCGYPRSTPNSW